jgi:16S rRNA (guanine(966)-N(2))-methyltransferase RsmD
VPAAPGLRPTGDRARETLFNVLAPGLAGVNILDVFAGSGAVGIEALSRGAAAAVFVERERRSAATLADNVALCGFADAAEILRLPWKAALLRLSARGALFDIAFFDPPYDWKQAHTLLEALASLALLAPAGIAVIEHRSGAAPGPVQGWEPRRVLAVGDTSFSFFGILAAP